VVLSIIPLVSMLLAVVDMDLERQKHGMGSPVKQTQPRYATSMNGNTATPYPAPVPTYAQGYQVAKPPVVPRVPVPQGGNGNGAVPFSPVSVTQ
jgi:hypothetical protein